MNSVWINNSQPALVLAPMEGVTDAPMRTFLTERGGFTYCVAEFLRISQEVLPPKTYFEHIPEIHTGWKTPSGTPVQLQLLGGNEERMALSALRGYELGAQAIDLNFGCPAPLVNRHDGGAAILRSPERVRSIVSAVRKAVPAHIPVSVKLRLGWEAMEDIYVNAEQAQLGGASWLTIHARTKTQGYAPPAYWEYIGEVKKRLEIPVVANGEIWSFEDFLRCRDMTGCQHFMIGRGALGDPALSHMIARELGLPGSETFERNPFGQDPSQWEPLLTRFAEITAPIGKKSQYTTRRIKQWLIFAGKKKDLPWLGDVKRAQNLDEVFAALSVKRSV